ncbi:T9SS type A sorting domain-containing protein [candidate division KSB1 bacterium]|nr:T9SS type A sorting domain-containing protein [candidate division KSB1 bacterium]
MRKIVLLSTILMFVPFIASAQWQWVLDNFDSSQVNSVYTLGTEGGESRITLTDDREDFFEGTGCLDMDAVIGAYHPWGSYAQLYYRVDETELMDWSMYDSLSLWIKVRTAPTLPENMYFRIHIADKPTPDGDQEEYIYENATILDQVSDWINLRIPLLERESDGSVLPNDEGFVLIPDNWNNPQNDRKFNRDKILGFNLTLVTSGWTDPDNLPADSMIVAFDEIKLFGPRAVPVIFFNGMVLPTSMTSWSWGQSSISLEQGAGATEGTNALLWVQGDEWGNGWTGVGFDIDPPFNLAASWTTDSLKFKMKVDEGTGAIRVQLEDNLNGDISGKLGQVFTPNDDGAWHNYAFKLDELTFQDGTSAFDSSVIAKIGFMAEASGIAGKKVYIDDIWTGDPVFDLVPPDMPTGVEAIPAQYYNLVIWEDVPGETGEYYNVYASNSPITDLNSDAIDKIASNVFEDEQTAVHWLYYPLEDQEVQYYYAVECVDKSGNVGPAMVTTSTVTNTAKGVPTISLEPPADFVADGDVIEWETSGIQPFVLTPETAYPWTTVTDAADLTATVYLAFDNDYLYLLADVVDDVYFYSTGNWWDQDAFQFFIGLFDQRGPTHTSIKRGDEPDYILYFVEDKIQLDSGGRVLATPDDENYHFEDFGGADYVIEAKISLDSLMQDTDKRFYPVRGMRIPLDLYFHDNDGAGWEGNLGLSPNATDHQYQNPSEWTYTWIGDTTYTSGSNIAVSDDVVRSRSYHLDQNYPNPFNPTTTINYAIAAPGNVTIELYNVVGQKVKTLVNKKQAAGQYNVTLNASDLTSGIYFYTIHAGEFTQTKKMVFMK